MRRLIGGVGLLVVLALTMLVVGCGGDDKKSSAGAPTSKDKVQLTQGSGLTFAMVTHSDEGSFWSVVKKGAQQAAKDEGVKLIWSPSNNDPQKEAQLISAAVSQKVDGLAVSVPNADAIKGALAQAKSANIPIITLNSGAEDFKALGAITHVGQTEGIAGEAAGAKLKDAGAKKVLCVIHEQNNIGLQQRCEGVAKGFGGPVTNLNVKGTADIATTQTELKSKLQADKSFDAVIALNPDIAVAAVTAVKGASSSAKVATFDITPAVLKDIKAGTVMFAVDQQQYLQGYLPIVFLKLFKENANTVGGGQPVLTGPGFVDKSNAATVEKLAGQGTREQRARGAGPIGPGRPPTAPERGDDVTSNQGTTAGTVAETGGTAPAAPPPTPLADERLTQISTMSRILRRPEIGALLAAVIVGIFFWTQSSLFLRLDGIANWTDVASTIGIPAVMVALLMIGGEFDLSAGVMTGSAGLMVGILATEVGMNIWLAIVLTLVAATTVGFINGYMVMATKLPSFIVTLATFFILQGVNLGVTKAITNQVSVSGLDTASGYDSANRIFGGTFWPPHDFKITVLWWIAITVLATWVLARTRVGNWIFGVGGDANAARNTGVPVERVKIGLFMTTSFVCALTGIMIALRLASTQAGQGVGDEFQFIIAAVVGGCVLTGGFGSAVGASLGAVIIGMAFIGIQFSGWNTDWRFLFLGVILLAAVLVNNYIRKRAEGRR
jgi:simple sugar transport system permease protein